MIRSSILTRVALLAGASIALPHLLACLQHPVKPVEYDKSATIAEGIALAINKDVDVLFVIDNSGSMGEEQATLSSNFGSFIRVLEADDVKANYRIAVTTSDFGNPRCTPDNFPVAQQGRFRLSSCRDRLGMNGGANEFYFEPEDNDQSTACTDFCSQEVHDALAPGVSPTTIEADTSEEPRAWIENIEGTTNLPDGVRAIADGLPENQDADPDNDISAANLAFRCYGPQGINGCGFESQLESQFWALARAEEPGEVNYGFLRDAAILSIVQVTDEADCSYVAAQQNVFLDLNNTVFWEDGASSPTSAVCWNAGVECDGAAPGPYTACRAVNKDISGAVIDDDNATDAVLQPISKYIEQINGIELNKKMIDQNQEVLVAGILGVPVNYGTDESVTIGYLDDPDQNEQIKFGIGAGCTSNTGGKAIPPVRLREFAEAFAVNDARNLFSICRNEYDVALEAIAERIRDQIKPACFKSCVKDTDPTTELVDPNCTLTEENTATGDKTDVPECAFNQDTGELVPPPGVTACFVYRYDKNGLTPSTEDDMDEVCISEGWNLEFFLIRTAAAKAGSSVTALCELTENVAVDCPNLGA